MCGIIGAALTHGRVESEALRQAAACLRHRGPDDEGVHVTRDERVGLAFRRLSIIDLSPAGHQPMLSSDGSQCIVFNGELYNFREIRRELEAKGHRFRSKSDTEVVLQAYAEWGARCLERFIGMYGFAIWDEADQSLFLARDRLGIKPLYYAVEPDGLRFASELKALLTAGLRDRALDASALRDYFTRGYIAAPRTIYRAVRSLPPAHWLHWRSGNVTIRRYWNAVDHATPRSRDPGAATEALDQLLRSAVRLQLVSDVPLGAFLSGGIDSSLVAALMRAESGSGVRTFSIGFPDAAHDESDRAAAIARHLGTEHRTLMATEADALALVPRMAELFDEPFADSSQIPTWLVSRLTRDHVTVALSGDGGDELFAGYATYARVEELERLWHIPPGIRRGLAPFLRRAPGRGVRLAAALDAADVLSYAESAWRLWPASALGRLVPALAHVADDSGFGYTSARYRTSGDVAERDPLERMMLSDLERYLPGDILTKVDRASMASSLEARVPLLDHRVVEFALGLPLDLKRRNGTSKWLLRQVLARYVPAALTAGPKRGFSVPLQAWLQGALRPLVRESLSTERVEAYGLLDPASVREAVAAGPASRESAERLWAVLMFQMWLDHYCEPGTTRIAYAPAPPVEASFG